MAIAQSRAGNVIVISGGAGSVTLAEALDIASIKYIGAAASTAAIAKLKADNTAGQQIWEESASTNVTDRVDIELPKGAVVTITGTAKVYLYLDDD